MSDISNSLFEAMKIFTDYSQAHSENTITISAAVTAVVDEGKGEYEVEYLGNKFNVFSNVPTSTYVVNDVVYVLVPDGDFTKTKIILSKVTPSADTFANTTDDVNKYYEISDNLIDKNLGIIRLSSYKDTRSSNYTITIMPGNNFATIIQAYLEKYRTFKFSFMVQTKLTLDQQVGGNYGVTLNIPVIVNAAAGGGASDQSWRSVTIDVGNMLGNPYRLTEWCPQSTFFTLDETVKYDPSRVPTFSYFCYDFPHDTTKESILDIELKDIAFHVVEAFTDEDTAGYRLTLKASEGNYFAANYKTTKTLTPTLRVNGKTTSIKKAEIYWAIEDASVRAENRYYSPYCGYGWRCLNERTNIAMQPDGVETFDYVTSITTWTVTQQEVKAAARYKCVVVLNGVASSAIVELRNLNATRIIDLVPTDGSNVFVKDTGYVNLTATVYAQDITETEANKSAISYSWLRYNKNGNLINDEDSFFEVVKYNQLVRKEFKGTTVNCYETQIRFPVNMVEDINTVYCTAKYTYLDGGVIAEELIGTKEVLVTTSTDFIYNLTITNADVLYKYDSDGDSPAGSAYDGPSTSKVTSIPALGYTIRKATGEELSPEEYCFVKYCWMVPKNSMFTVTRQSGTGTYTDDDNYYYFEGYDTYQHSCSLAYGIATRYNKAKSMKQIIFKAEFQGVTMEREIPITFMKEGMSGSNGTTYAAELVSGGLNSDTSVPYGTPNAKGVAQKLKFVYNISNNTLYRHDLDSNTLVVFPRGYGQSGTVRRIYPKVYENGQIINPNYYTVDYEMFDSRVTNPCFGIVHTDGYKGVQLGLIQTPTTSERYCNILQAKIKVNGQGSQYNADQELYCYYPIELTVTNFNTSIVPSVDGGFAEVMYASDGTNPSWDETSPFVCNDIAMLDGNLSDYFDIYWDAQYHFTPNSATGRVFSIKPGNKYDDGNSKNMVTASLSFKASAEALVNNRIAILTSERNEYNNQISSLNQNKVYLENFARAYKGSTWKGILDRIQKLLDKQTNAVYSLNFLLENTLVSIDNYINAQVRYNKPQVTRVCGQLIADIGVLKSEVERAIRQVQKLDGTSGYNYNNLISLRNKALSWNNSIKETYTNSLGLTTALELQALITDVNRQIEDYQRTLDELLVMSSTNNLTEYKRIKDDITAMCSVIPDSAFPYIVRIKNLCLAYRDNFDRCTSIRDIKSCISGMYDTVLRGVFFLQDTILSLSAATVKDFADQVQRNTDLAAAATAEITTLNGILSTKGKTIVHSRPIVLYFNRYEMSNINAWDGNKVYIGDDYLLAPQAGFGIKESDNSFTGLLMGQRKLGSQNQVGLFGYESGEQSIFMNARTGATTLGKSGKGGQIILDPASSEHTGMLYSSNYWKTYSNYTGMPSSYGDSNKAYKGLCFDFTNAEIHIGDSDGKIYSGKHTSLTSNNKGFHLSHDGLSIVGIDNDGNIGKIILDTESNNPKIYSNSKSEVTSTKNGFHISNDGLSLGSKAYISSVGMLRLGKGAVAGTGKHWTIDASGDESYIKYGTRGSSNSVYIATDEITLGSKFRVTDKGVAYIGSGAVTGTGKHWTINGGDESYMAYGTTAFDSSNLDSADSYSIGGGNNQVYVGTDGIRLGNKFAVDRNGNAVVKHLIAKSGGTIGGWAISSNALTASNIQLNSGGTIQTLDWSDGGSGWKITGGGNAYFNHLKANKSGEIAGWTISSTGFSNGNIKIGTDGSIRHTGGTWSIGNNGVAHFKNITCDTTWTFGSGSNIWSNASGTNTLTFGSGTIGGSNNTVNSNGLGFSKGTVGLSGTVDGKAVGITFNNNECTFKGKIVANALEIKGDANCSGIKLYTDSSHYLYFGTGGNKHPTASGLNIEGGGIVMNGNAGIDNCPNIGKGGAVWTFNSGATQIETSAYLKVSGSSYLKIGDRDLSTYVNDVVKTYKAKGTITVPKDGGSVSVELSLS